MFSAALIFILSLSARAAAADFDCAKLLPKPNANETYAISPFSDFAFRDSLPQSTVPKADWPRYGSWGPCAAAYPKVVYAQKDKTVEWSRLRVIEAAKKMIGTKYAHFHTPQMGGLDCSNFTAFVYNYALGVRFTSNVHHQAESAGRLLSADEAFAPGDLIYIHAEQGPTISHVVIFIDAHTIIDSTGIGVQIRPFEGWYKRRLAWARRVID